MAQQLSFDLPSKPALGRADFLVAPSNQIAVAALDSWRDWPEGKLAIVGPEGAGKTHLAHVWAGEVSAEIVPARALADRDPHELAGSGAVVVEDAETIAKPAEEPLFHLHNLLRQKGGALLLMSDTAPARWPIVLPDLASRMQATTVVEISPPDDMLLQAVMVKLFADRQIEVPANVPPYVLGRIERSFAAVGAAVAALDKAALEAGQGVTRPLAGRVLDNFPSSDT